MGLYNVLLRIQNSNHKYICSIFAMIGFQLVKCTEMVSLTEELKKL